MINFKILKKIKQSCFFLLTVLLISCSKENNSFDSSEIAPETLKRPNILLIIADDIGLDACPGYNVATEKPIMPTLSNLINTGITFNNVWSNPVCTPTRSTILTGKYGFRTNMMNIGDELSTSEISIQKYIDNNLGQVYNHAVIGKWHLSTDPNHPINMGVNYYAGLLTGSVSSYWDWNLTENGLTTNCTEYSTTKITDLAIDWVDIQSKPWFLWLAYNAPHTPFHLPSTNLHTQGYLPTDEASIAANPLPYYFAMLEAMDTEIGRLLNSMSTEERENTVIIFIGDNGTPNEVVQEYNSKRAKGTLYQGGVNVPMVISGKNVSRTATSKDALINLTDLYATIASIAGVEVLKINDSYNFKSLLSNSEESIRDYAYSEIRENSTTSSITIRNLTHKYMLFEDESESLYNLSIDPFETKNLLNSRNLPLSDYDNLMKEELITKLKILKN